MGFIKNQQIKAAVRLLTWHYEKHSGADVDRTRIEKHARQLVDDAHRIARKRGGNVLAILKEMVMDMRRKDA